MEGLEELGDKVEEFEGEVDALKDGSESEFAQDGEVGWVDDVCRFIFSGVLGGV